MFNKQNLVDSISNELRIIKHLAVKVPADQIDYRPTIKQRSTIELLQYLSYIAVAGARLILGEEVKWEEYTDAAKNVTLENFAEAIDKQDADIKAVLAKFTDEELAKITNIFGAGDKAKGVYLVEFLVKWLAAYKMQLFLYVKQSGVETIGTSNLWAGMDMPVKAE